MQPYVLNMAYIVVVLCIMEIFRVAMLALFAPKIPGTTSRGGTRLHKILAWVHGSGMIATPILGALAYQQKSRGEHVHGVAKLHPFAAWTTTLAYGAAMASVSFKF